MKDFSPSDAALEGFRLTREHPGMILTWGGVYFLGVMLMAMVMAAGLGPQFVAFMKDGELDAQEMDAFAELLVNSWPAFLLVLAMVLIFFAIITGAVYRLVLRPQQQGFAGLRLGADEVRLAIVHFIMFAILLGFAIVFDVLASAAGGIGQASPAVLSFIGLAVILASIWVGVRLSLATPMTFAEGKISVSAAWRLTRGRFWPLFGMIALAVIFYVMVFILITIIGVACVALAGGQAALTDMSNLSPAAMAAFAITLVIQLLLPILQVVTLYAPFATAYRELRGPVEPVGAEAPATRS